MYVHTSLTFTFSIRNFANPCSVGITISFMHFTFAFIGLSIRSTDWFFNFWTFFFTNCTFTIMFLEVEKKVGWQFIFQIEKKGINTKYLKSKYIVFWYNTINSNYYLVIPFQSYSDLNILVSSVNRNCCRFCHLSHRHAPILVSIQFWNILKWKIIFYLRKIKIYLASLDCSHYSP